MTNPHEKAVEAAGKALMAVDYDIPDISDAVKTVNTVLAAMRAEGWVMVRDVGELEWSPPTDGDRPTMTMQNVDGWNACRAAMLKGAGDEQG